MKLHTIKRTLLATGLAIGLSACGIMSNDSRYDPVDLTDYTQTATGQIAWKVSIGSGSGYGFAPALYQDGAFAATPDGNVIRVNATNGAMVWRTDLDIDLAGGVGVNEGVVAVTTQDGYLIALDAATGKEQWRTRLSTISSMPPTIAEGKVFARSDDFRVQAFNLSDGQLLWSYLRTHSDLSLRTNSRMIVEQNTVLAAVPSGRLVALNASTGRVNWDLLAAVVKGPSDLDSVTDVVGLPVLGERDLCVASYQGNVLCAQFTQQGPAVRWAVPFSSSVGISGARSTIIGAGIDGTVSVFNRDNGQVLWSDDTLRNRGLTNPIVANDFVMVGDYEGYMHFYDFQTGTLRGRFSVGSDPIVSPLVPMANGVIVQTGEGNLVLFGAQ